MWARLRAYSGLTPICTQPPFASTPFCSQALGTAIIVLGSNLAAHLFLAASLSAALLTGASVTGAVYLFRGVSGAHFNPAVTLAFAAQGTTRSREVVPYVLAQGSGALFGSSLALLSGPMVSRALTSAAKPAAFMAAPALHAEALATSLLIIAIFQIGDQVRGTPSAARPSHAFPYSLAREPAVPGTRPHSTLHTYTHDR